MQEPRKRNEPNSKTKRTETGNESKTHIDRIASVHRMDTRTERKQKRNEDDTKTNQLGVDKR